MYFDWNLTIEELQIYRELGYLLFLKMFVKKSCELACLLFFKRHCVLKSFLSD